MPPEPGKNARCPAVLITRIAPIRFKATSRRSEENAVSIPDSFGQGAGMDKKRLGKAVNIMRLAEEAAARPYGVDLH
jgi:hypothetical protein